jgi:monoterpene epsilon-lactone hydrolase
MGSCNTYRGLAEATILSMRDEKERLPAGIVCISPWADLTLAGEWLSTCSKCDPLLSGSTSLLPAG